MQRLEGILGPVVASMAPNTPPILPELPKDQIVWGPDCLIKPKVKHLYQRVKSRGTAQNQARPRDLETPGAAFAYILSLETPGCRLEHCCPNSVSAVANVWCVGWKMEHLFFQCPKSKAVWQQVESFWKHYAKPSSVRL